MNYKIYIHCIIHCSYCKVLCPTVLGLCASNLQDEAFFMHDADDDNFSCQMHCDSSSQRVTCCASRKFHAQQSTAGAGAANPFERASPHKHPKHTLAPPHAPLPNQADNFNPSLIIVFLFFFPLFL